MAGMENSVASRAFFSRAGKISPPGSRLVLTPIFCMTLPPKPKKRILRPFRSSGLLISLLNQPEVSGAMTPQSRTFTL